MRIARVALDVPLDELFDFQLPPGMEAPLGSLVLVPFGKSRKVGVVAALANRSAIAPERLREVEKVIADVGALGPSELELFDFCARYYLRPLGEVIGASLPPRLRQVRRRALGVAAKPELAQGAPEAPALTAEQEAALAICRERPNAFHPVLLQGVTGSGKTEIYFRLIRDAVLAGRQVLFLVPEISLTPQLETVVRGRFPGEAVAIAHSGMAEGERAVAWLAAQGGAARIVLGTRLAVLMPFRDLGLIVVDEEHDPSYKQHEGLRYSARDVAVRRAQLHAIPVVLGSATPSLETYANAREGRYCLARLDARAVAGAQMPGVRMVDTRADRPQAGLTSAVLRAIGERLEQREQSLVFLNRRGFSPVLFCRSCQWHSVCARCSANLVLHRAAAELRCHHCGHRERAPSRCPNCAGVDLAPVGHGTQRVEESLRETFAHARLARIDRDSTARKGVLRDTLAQVRSREIDILVGTQMLAKGHDYPDLTLVAVVDSDSALFSADFRAAERLFAQLVQVSGRAGRASRRGEVLIQTDFPGHPLYAAVARHDFDAFATAALDERHSAAFPPFSHLALLRAESKRAGEALAFLRKAQRLAGALQRRDGVEVFDPVPAPLERRAGYERAQLLVRAAARPALHRFLQRWKTGLAAHDARQVRWSLDVDPQEV